jgi:hypothetical protein
MAVGSASVANFAYTETGVAAEVVAQTTSTSSAGLDVGGSTVCIAYAPLVPAGALYDRSGATILDRAGAYIEVRA